MAVYRLDDELWFPDPHYGEDDGLVAVGGDLSINRLLLAYSHGFFPWYPVNLEDEPRWYCPLDRFVIFPNEIHVSHSMRTMLNKGIYEISFNQAFKQVIQGCSKVDGRDRSLGAWLDGLCRLIHTMFYRRYNRLKTSELLNFYSDVRFSLFLEESF